MRRAFLLAVLIFLSFTHVALASGSADTVSLPSSWFDATVDLAGVEQQALVPLDTPKLAAEDAVAEAFGQPPRFAVPHELAESSAKTALWTTSGALSRWRMRVSAPGSVSLNFGFRNVHLVEGARLWIYPADAFGKAVVDRSEILGPYGVEINEVHGEFWTPVVQADDVIIELEAPTELRDRVSFELMRVNQGYRGFGRAALAYRQPEPPLGEGKREGDCEKGSAGAKSGSCNMDVACLAPTDPWNDPRRAVAVYSIGGVFACTGSLVNNTANDRRMLFATASHCGITNGNAPSMVAYWNYEWPTCRTPGSGASSQVNAPDASQTSSGAHLIARTIDPFDAGQCTNPGSCSDFTLVEFDDPANPDWDLFWAGWDRRSTPASCGPQGADGSTEGLCASIHHPSTDEKRITFVPSDLIAGSIASAQGVHWHAFWHPDPPVLAGIPAPQPSSIPPGVTEPGSSGSPLYSSNQRLVGVLSGGPAFCGATGAQLSDFYGQLAHAWNGLGTPSTRMRDHLDPLDTGVQFIDGIGASPFQIDVDDDFVLACASDGSVGIPVDLVADAGFSSPVTLSVSGAPPGASTAFSPNPLTPPGSSTLTIGSLGSATTGTRTLTIGGQSGGDSDEFFLGFHLASSAPNAANPSSPANGARGLDADVTLSWSGAARAAGVWVEVATDYSFRNVVFSRFVRDASSVQVSLDSRTQYFWRTTAENGCGATAPSATRSFITAPATGECPVGTQSTAFWSDDMESGSNGWTLGSGSTQNTWARISSDSVSGNFAWQAINVASLSDQRLVSPPIDLPNIEPLTLRFQNRQELEAGGAGCYDGAVLEISTNGGNSWTALSGNRIGYREHDGPIDSGFGNPLAGTPAWCGDPRGWEDYAIDLSDFAGETVRLRYRVATDSSVGGRDGWLIDDVRVEGCGSVDDQAPISGNFYNPDRDGEGCQLTREANERTYILTCYVYNRNDPYPSDQVWMIGTGELEDGRIDVADMQITGGADYGAAFDPSDVVRMPFGPVSVEFDDCNNATVSMDPIVAGFEDVVLPMQKIVPVQCDRGLPDPVNAAHAGNWFDPDRDGEGFQLAVEGGNGVHVITYYTYLDGSPVWLIGAGQINGDTIVFPDMTITSGTGFGSDFDKDDVVRTPFGTLTLQFQDCNFATVDVDSVLADFPDQQIAVERIVKGACPD